MAERVSLFDGPGELAALMRAKDWHETALGPVEQWPRSLQTLVRVMLTSRYAMWLGWGSELTFLYNDAYRPTLGVKHPATLGQPAQQVWAEIWPQIGPRIDHVLASGEATWDEALLLFLERSGFAEETYHTFSYSPAPDDSGGTGGMLCVVTEETVRVIGERHLAVLRALAAELSAADDVAGVYRAVERTVRNSSKDLPFAVAYSVGGGRRDRLLSSSTGDPGAGTWRHDELAVIDEPVVIDLAPSVGWPRGPWPLAPVRAMALPLDVAGRDRSVLIAGLNPHRPLDATYRDFLGLFAGQVTAALARAHAFEDERRRAEALAELDRAKTAFFSNVSHEFRTPLTLLLGPLADLLVDPEVAPAVAHQLGLMHRNGLRLHKLVNTMLDFSRIEAGRMKSSYAPVDLAAATRGLAAAFRSTIERVGLHLAVDLPDLDEPVYVDHDHWEKIVLNLLSNAFKFTLEGEIAVAMRLDGEQVELTVRDSGVGIPAGDLPHLFERFHRVESTRGRTFEGTGIGLALVQELVKLHGGTITAASELGHGTTFTVRLPRGRDHLPADRIAQDRRPGGSSAEAFVEEALRWMPAEPTGEIPTMSDGGDAAAGAVEPAGLRERVVLADDNADMRDYIARIVGTRWQVEAVANGRAALAAIEREPPALVITDVMMPELDGFGLLAALRADRRTRDLPVIMLSARAGEEARVEGLEAGASDYLVKPFTARELVARVESQLLRRRLHELETNELVVARTAAEAANRAKDEFLAMLGHELRNPLAPIQTALELMRMRLGDQVLREREVIERQVRHMVALVDDLLDVSRITQNKVQLRVEPTEVAQAVGRAIEMAGPLFERHRHRLIVEVPRTGLVVDADPARLAQMIANLMTNAAKYTPSGGEIAVRAALEGDQVAIHVRDNGIGIDPAMLERIFEPFAQERQAIDRAQGGLGLGLAIVQSLAIRHGGSITATSEGRGHGSEFVIRLPASSARAGTVAHAADPSSSQPIDVPQRVLIVDDNADAALMLADMLDDAGFETRVAHDGPSALAIASAFAPAVAVLDLGLPVMDGYDLAHRFRDDAALRTTRLVALTGYGQDSDRTRTREVGFSAHLVKPVDFELLRKTIDDLLAVSGDQ